MCGHVNRVAWVWLIRLEAADEINRRRGAGSNAVCFASMWGVGSVPARAMLQPAAQQLAFTVCLLSVDVGRLQVSGRCARVVMEG